MQDIRAKMQKLSWDNYRFVLAIYRCQTIAAAARSLCVNETTVSRRLAQTEKYLHFKLFSRHPKGLVPTDAGLNLIQRIEMVNAELDAVEIQAWNDKQEVAGNVRIVGDSMLINRMLVPNIGDVLNNHPELYLEFISDTSVEKLTNADMVIQIGEPQQSPHSVSTLLGSLDYAVYIADSDSNASSHSSIPWVICKSQCSPSAFENGFMPAKDPSKNSSAQRIVVDNSETQLSCVYSGLGKCQLVKKVGMHDPRLRCLDPDEPDQTREVWLSSSKDYHSAPRIQTCARWLESCVSTFNAR